MNLPDGVKTWFEFYKYVIKNMNVDSDETIINWEDHETFLANKTNSCKFRDIKLKAFDEIYSKLPTKEETHKVMYSHMYDNRKFFHNLLEISKL